MDVPTYIRRANLRYCWRRWHPLERYLLVPLCEQEWGKDWYLEIEKEAVCSSPR